VAPNSLIGFHGRLMIWLANSDGTHSIFVDSIFAVPAQGQNWVRVIDSDRAQNRCENPQGQSTRRPIAGLCINESE